MTTAVRRISVAFLAMGLASICSAAPIIGSLALSGLNVSANGNGTDLSTTTVITTSGLFVTSAGVGDFNLVPTATVFDTPVGLDFTNFPTFTFSNATWGNWSTTSGLVLQHTSNFIDIFLLGVFNPGPGFSTQTSNDSSLRISVNSSSGPEGISVSEAVTLSSPALQLTPEPATMALLGGALIGLGLLKRKRSVR